MRERLLKRRGAVRAKRTLDLFPMLPLVSLYEQFDPLQFSTMMTVFDNLKSEIKRLAKVNYVQGDLFDFMQGGEG